MFRKHFPLPWTAIWPMTKNSTGTWESSQPRVERNLREVMSARGNLLYWLDLSFWSSFYFISSQPATWILIFSTEQFFLLWLNSTAWCPALQLVSSAVQCSAVLLSWISHFLLASSAHWRAEELIMQPGPALPGLAQWNIPFGSNDAYRDQTRHF